MTTTTKQSKQARLTAALLAGQNFTVNQIRSRFNIANPTATISSIRFSGVPVFANSATKADGTKITVYRTGKAPKAVIAAGYRAMAAGLV
jgi:hypothetical protein